ECLDGGNVTAAGHDHVGRGALIGAGPRPDAKSRGAMLDGGINVEPLGLGLLAGDDDIDVVPASEAVVHDGKQTVGVGGKIDANDLGLLVDDVIYESGILMAESVVVLTPDMRGQKIVERGDRAAPRNVP